MNEWVWQGSSILLNVSKWQHTLLLKLAVMINTEYKMDKISGDRCTPLALSHISIVWFTLVFIIFLSQNHSYSLENWPWTLWLREASVERRWINQWSQERFVPHVNIAGPQISSLSTRQRGSRIWIFRLTFSRLFFLYTLSTNINFKSARGSELVQGTLYTSSYETHLYYQCMLITDKNQFLPNNF